MSTIEQSQSKIQLLALVAYYAILVTMLAASFFPAARLWGLSGWLHYPVTVRLILCGLGAILPVLLLRQTGRTTANGDSATKRNIPYALVVAIALAVWAALFYLLRARMHFEGDGYLLLSSLADGNLPIKFTNYGESVIHRFVYALVGGGGSEDSLLTYQLVSCFAGVVFAGAVAATSWKLYDNIRKRTLFLFGLTTGGYMLLFFGHVEHYSLFVLSVGLFAFVGVLIVHQRLNRWLILLPLALAVFLHILGVTLIVPAVYILFRQTRLSKILSGCGRWYKWGLAAVAIAVGIGLAYWQYVSSYVFRFSLVPVVEDRFTLDGYTLLSGKHLADMFNLLILLLPSLPIAVAILIVRRRRESLLRAKYIFLLLMLGATAGAAFVFDPKLGMARDWDLFSFCGVPLVLLAYSFIFDAGTRDRWYPNVAILAIGLGVLSLFPRAYNHTNEEISLNRMDDYITLDPLRNRGGMNLVLQYHINADDSTSAMAEYAKWPTRYPEWAINRQGTNYLNTRRFQEAIGAFKQTIAINPSFSAAYSNLASAYLYIKQYDSAIEYYAIAEGMNPNSPTQLSNLGAAYYYSGDYETAERTLLKATRLSPKALEPQLTLAMLYQKTDRQEEYVRILEDVVFWPGAPRSVLEDLTKHYIKQGQPQKAQDLLDALKSGTAETP